jgi:Mg/Co/Ni transporter MgtE
VSDFLQHASEAKYWEEMKDSIVYPSDTLRDVIQKFLLTKSQNVYLDEKNHLLGVIDINDIINYLL